jgi:TOMM system kinase/cyclase fusion protein
MALGDLDGPVRAARVERFRREIAFCSSLYHPDIVRLLDSGELADGNRFAVFEFIPGRTLAELLRDEAMLKVQRARSLLGQLLPPLAYAHSMGIAHRDLKPGNVMVMSDGGRDRLKILDFGISISVGSQDHAELARLTQSHEWIGTPLYAAPEQLRGDVTGPKVDLYAWGLMFVECLTGTTLIRGESLLQILAQQSRAEPHVLPPALAGHRLGALLLRTLEKDPARRLGDAQLIHAMLERIALDGLEDPQGYLRETSPVSARYRARQSLTDTVTDAAPAVQTEQRHVTTLCCWVSLMGSGGLSSIEQIDALLDDSYNLVHEVLRQFGATPAQSVGGYSLWYFGISQTSDADARLAVRGALEVINRLETLPQWFGETGLALVVRLGVHSGPVTVQLLEGERKPIDGVTARIALQLAAFSARPASEQRGHRILVSEDFRQLVVRYAELERFAPGDLALPWREEPLKAYRLQGESRATERRARAFVGREQEREQIDAAWQKARSGQGCAIMLCGEPGIGKSRLAAELSAGLEREGSRTLELRCLPEWQNASLRPLQILASDLIGLGSTASKAPELLELKLAELGLDLRVAIPLFCGWLAASMPPGYAPLAYSPQKQRHLLHNCIVDLLLAAMDRGSLLLIEDLHWADPSTLECLDRLLGGIGQRRAFVLMTTRPERTYNWAEPPVVVNMVGLSKEAAVELAAALVPKGTLTNAELSQMVARSDGIPLYLEELALALAGLAPREGTAPDAAAGQVPPSLRNLLTSRLELLGHSRQTAQFAAALGREFSLDLLTALETRDELALASDLEELVSVQILVKRLRIDSPVYAFRHALIRDAAYESMSPDARRRSHELIADGLKEKFSSLSDTQPDVLAHHYEGAAQFEQAMTFWNRAAQRASSASAHVEAMSHVERALQALRQLGDAPALHAREAGVLLTRAAILVATRGYPGGAPDFERIIELVPARPPTLELAFAARWGIWNFHNARCSLEVSSRLADELTQLAQGAEDRTLRLAALSAVCTSSFCTGRLRQAVEASRLCAAQYDIEKHRTLTLQYGDDPHVSSSSFEALAEMIRGRHGVALQRVREVMAVIDQLGYPAQRAGMHGQAAWLFLQWGDAGAVTPDYDRALEHANAALKIAQEHGFPFWELYGTLTKAAARAARGDTGAAHELRTYSDIWCSFGANLGRCWHLAFVGTGLHKAGSFTDAQQAFEDALAFCEAHDSRYFEAEVHRRLAVLLADPENPAFDLARALEHCQQGATQAASIGARWWQLACSMTELRLTPEHDGLHAALGDLLASAFPLQADEPPLLREARALLG